MIDRHFIEKLRAFAIMGVWAADEDGPFLFGGIGMIRGFCALLLSLFLVGCSSLYSRPSSGEASSSLGPSSFPSSSPLVVSPEYSKSYGKPSAPASVQKGSLSSFQIVENENVKKWIEYFTSRGADVFQRALNRGFFYEGIVKTSLEESGLPEELFFLPLIESSYVSHAKSRSKAVGIWQFMKGTGKRYGLRVNASVDERRDPIRASKAAVKYLKDLHTVFHSWELALAAYNCGEHRVLRAVMKGDSRNFWTLARKKLLPKETRNYVPKLMAAVIIGQNPERFGFQHPRHLGLKRHPAVKAVPVPPFVPLAKVAGALKTPRSQLKKINPQLRRGHTGAFRGKASRIWIPEERAVHSRKLASLKGHRVQRRRRVSRKSESKSSRYHIVRRGENLTQIAQKYGKKLSTLRRLNGLASSLIFPGQRLRISPSSKGRGPYRVRKGDNLSRIASLFGVSIAHIKRKNRLRSSRIFVGQKLRL
ncbi:MAG: transglycosylase SLT domain-containing protein [Bacteriovoracales bacterium]|nr:transglycosylase SLT domain-containing protein [Bacteriovoracales bacterium]